ncbi:MAG: endonuclease/exonuclease/phosphatase family metal-dependent hydrolase [Myxococcota bacterium]|jgi:endonuclease/exonuclease/phosphatase family metal-dependent hydrolase
MRRIALAGLVSLSACGGKGTDSADSAASTGATTAAATLLRIAGWNVEGLGRSSTDEFVAARDVLARMNADVVVLCELDEGEGDTLTELAVELGYGWRLYPASNPFGDLRNALLARVPARDGVQWTSADLSGDRDANDVTRLPLEVTVEVGGHSVRVIGTHLKSGFSDSDAFRRAVDATRVAQAVSAGAAGPVVVLGDLNADAGDDIPSPDPWTSEPGGAPGSYALGEDVQEQLRDDGVRNTPFPLFEAVGLSIVDAAQLDGRYATRDSSDRRIDYALVSGGIEVRGEVYDSRDDDGSGIADGDTLPERDATSVASDHFPVLVELTLR